MSVDGFQLTINTRDERGHKPHVHVVKAGAKCVIMLDASFATYKPRGMSRRGMARARVLVAKHFDLLMEWWIRYND